MRLLNLGRLTLMGAVVFGRIRSRNISAGGLTIALADMRPRRSRDVGGLAKTVAAALERLSEAGGGFGELVCSHLLRIVAMDIEKDRLLPEHQSYVCRFDGKEASNPHYLAALMVWAATSIRLARDQGHYSGNIDKGGIREAARAAQRRFLEQFEGSDEWVKSLDLGDVND